MRVQGMWSAIRQQFWQKETLKRAHYRQAICLQGKIHSISSIY